jgi:hypothetical protein
VKDRGYVHPGEFRKLHLDHTKAQTGAADAEGDALVDHAA